MINVSSFTALFYHITSQQSVIHLLYEPPLLQAGLIFRQGYVPDKRPINRNRANRTQNPHLKQCISWRLGDWKPLSYVVYDNTTIVHTDL